MSATPAQLQRRKFTPFKGFVTVFLGVFLLVFMGTAIVTFALPDTFVAAARVRAATPDQAACFQSDTVLAEVSDKLNLARRFARRYGQTEPLAAARTLEMLRRALQVRRIPNTSLAEICAYSQSPDEAALLANAVADAGLARLNATAQYGAPALLDRAVPPRRPVRPNTPLNLLLGALVGAMLGVMAGGVGARIAVGAAPDNAPEGSPPNG